MAERLGVRVWVLSIGYCPEETRVRGVYSSEEKAEGAGRVAVSTGETWLVEEFVVDQLR